MSNIFAVGDRVVSKDNNTLEGTITFTPFGGDAIVHWHNGTKTNIAYSSLVHAEPNRELNKFKVGDLVSYKIDNDQLIGVGTVVHVGNDLYLIKEPSGSTMTITGAHISELSLYEWNNVNEQLIGERVYFIEDVPLKYPLGVVICCNETVFTILWDNGVIAEHIRQEFQLCDEAIEALSRPVPKE